MNALFALDPRIFDWIYPPGVVAEIAELVNLRLPTLSADNIRHSPGKLRDIDIILSGWGGPRLDAGFLAAASNLKAFFYGAGSIKHLTTDAFWDSGIPITSAAAANAIPVSEYTLSQILFCLKAGWKHDRQCRGNPTVRNIPSFERHSGPGCFGTTVGLISLGTIGRLVRERLRAHDVSVLACDPFVSARDAAATDIQLCSLKEVFQRAHVVSLHTPLLPETENMIREEHFRAMRKDASFINTARSGLVDHAGLVKVLQERPDLWAVLDVTETATDQEYQNLCALPNVTLTPHIAGSEKPECERMGRLMVAELRRFLRGEPLQHAVTKERVALMA